MPKSYGQIIVPEKEIIVDKNGTKWYIKIAFQSPATVK